MMTEYKIQPAPPSPLDKYFAAAVWKEAQAIESATRANIGRLALIARDSVCPRSIHLVDARDTRLATIRTSYDGLVLLFETVQHEPPSFVFA